MEPEVLFRVIIVGDTGVGKSCFLLRFTEDRFKEQHTVTIGVEFGTKILRIGGRLIKLQIWDTAGQENFRSITRSFYRKADGVILMYDVTSASTFNNCEYWLEEIRQNSSIDSVVYLVGNQLDLEETSAYYFLSVPREVSFQQGSDFSTKHQLSGFKETSAKTGSSVEEVFSEFALELYTRWKDSGEDSFSKQKFEIRTGVTLQDQKRKTKCKC